MNSGRLAGSGLVLLVTAGVFGACEVPNPERYSFGDETGNGAGNGAGIGTLADADAPNGVSAGSMSGPGSGGRAGASVAGSLGGTGSTSTGGSGGALGSITGSTAGSPTGSTECEPGTRRCRELTPQRCTDQGTWIDDGAACSSSCMEGVCAGACSDGATQCSSGSEAQQCRGGQWGQSTVCEFACVDNACGGACRPGDTQCASATEIQTCGTVGAWAAPVACDFVCSGKACDGQCKPSAKRCSSTTQVQTCDASGAWGTPTACEYACVNDACDGLCKPGEKRCGAAGSSVETCSVTGLWEAKSCPDSCVDAACTSCLPGDTECVSSTQLRTCGENGEWDSASECTHACASDQCGGVCKPGARQCVPGAASPQTQECDQSGKWGAPTTCTTEPACVDGVCKKDPKYVFVTSTRYSGNLGGLNGADMKCQQMAGIGGLPGTYRAFLSDATGSPSTRFSKQGGPYRRVDGVVVAQSFDDLVTNGLTQLIDKTEAGGTPPDAAPGPGQSDVCGDETAKLVWTNTTRTGTALTQDGACSNWTATAYVKTAWGRWDDPDHWWGYCRTTGGDIDRCASLAPLYCFQQ